MFDILSFAELYFNWHQSIGLLQGFLYIIFKMDNAKEGGYVNQPRILDGTNYDYWKAHVVSFLKYMDNKTWKLVMDG